MTEAKPFLVEHIIQLVVNYRATDHNGKEMNVNNVLFFGFELYAKDVFNDANLEPGKDYSNSSENGYIDVTGAGAAKIIQHLYEHSEGLAVS